MNIICRPYLYKVVTASAKNRLITTWNEEDPIEQFEAVEKVKLPLGVSDTEIVNKYHEITKARAAKLYEQKNGKPQEPAVEDQNQE